MKRRIILFAILSLALGIVLTTLFAYKKTDWHYYGDCAETMDNTLPSGIRRVDCSGLAYGFPYTFVQSEPRLDVSYLTEPHTSPVMLGVTAQSGFDAGRLLANIAIWSIVSSALIGGGRYWLSRRQAEPTKTTNAKNQNHASRKSPES